MQTQITYMFKKLKQKSIKKRISKALSKRDLTHRNTTLKTLGFLVEDALVLDEEMFYNFSKKCEIDNKDLSVFTYKEIKKKEPTLKQNQLNNKDFSWRGELVNQNAKDFLEKPFDVIVGYYKENNLFLDYLMAQSKAKFKVGFKHTDERILDLVLHVDSLDFNSFSSEFLKYMKILKKI